MRNFRQRRCRYCRTYGGDYGQHSGPCLSAETIAELKAFAAKHGRTWRKALRHAWLTEEPILRELRNRVGPSRLDGVKPPVLSNRNNVTKSEAEEDQTD